MIGYDLRDSVGAETYLLTRNLESLHVPLLDLMFDRSLDLWHLHQLGFRVRDMAEVNCEIDCSELITTMYEVGPCSMCRHGCVDYLAGRQDIPAWMGEEIVFDCYPETQAKAVHLS